MINFSFLFISKGPFQIHKNIYKHQKLDQKHNIDPISMNQSILLPQMRDKFIERHLEPPELIILLGIEVHIEEFLIHRIFPTPHNKKRHPSITFLLPTHSNQVRQLLGKGGVAQNGIFRHLFSFRELFLAKQHLHDVRVA